MEGVKVISTGGAKLEPAVSACCLGVVSKVAFELAGRVLNFLVLGAPKHTRDNHSEALTPIQVPGWTMLPPELPTSGVFPPRRIVAGFSRRSSFGGGFCLRASADGVQVISRGDVEFEPAVVGSSWMSSSGYRLGATVLALASTRVFTCVPPWKVLRSSPGWTSSLSRWCRRVVQESSCAAGG